ncbi:hypothetical protein JX265_012252 [Neoarthrinium moseri]|uniref:DUF7053 domain-containing protein n=1 Tax=Neoarthrinium moseri TaxID=1658444 RepID=A0A9Q0AJV6_9PEZI|nr:uncharacterized protein JN550_004432 [Neoarthrinium moseri]KAI1849787.1 hypothetical protein JX266_004736 [Neoarthrinium moseri]KAI1855064.1 hypothetical protein JX265_012252 [Neoarthrinium moseri]KAI1871438.1 hypothetical protein JN550_004432 [Neoarthrinium moseri]
MSPTETRISTAFSEDTSGEAILNCLHNHDRYIRTTCPQLISYKHVSGVPDLAYPCVYEVTDKRPIGQTTYTLTLVNQKDGIDAHIDGKAPTGAINIQSKWRVTEDMLEEVILIDSNMLMNKMIKGGVEKNHPAQHQGFIEAGRA